MAPSTGGVTCLFIHASVTGECDSSANRRAGNRWPMRDSLLMGEQLLRQNRSCALVSATKAISGSLDHCWLIEPSPWRPVLA